MLSYPFTSQVTYDDEGLPKYDRAVDSKFLRLVYAKYFSDGVFFKPTNSLQVVADTGMQVVVEPGTCHIQGAIGIEDKRRTLVVQASEEQDRIDTVVARLDLSRAVRSIDLYVVKGVAAESPQAPALTRDATTWEIGLGDLFVAKNTQTISQQRITDTRLNPDRCGQVTQAPGDFDTAPYFAQLQAAIDQYNKDTAAQLAEIQAKAEEQLADQAADLTAWFGVKDEEFTGWFETIKGKLGEDPAGSLQNQVDALNAAVTGYPLRLTAGTNSLQITAKKNSVESVQVNGFTSDGQSGGLRLVQAVFDGSPDEAWTVAEGSAPGPTGAKRLSITLPISVPNTNNNIASVAFFNILKNVAVAPLYDGTEDNVGGVVNSGSSNSAFIAIRLPGIATEQGARDYLNSNNLIVSFLPTDESQATGLYIPIETQGSEYHCEMLEITEALGDGDNVQSFVVSGCDKEVVIDGKTNTIVVRESENYGYVNIADPDGYSRDKVPVSNLLPYTSNLSGNEYLGFNAYSVSGGYGFNFRLPVDASVEAYIAYLQEHPLVVYLRSLVYTEQSDLPISLETHTNGNVYAHDPVQIPNEDGATNVSTPEGCVLEIDVTRNEAKEYTATLINAGWQSSGSEYTQTAEVKCVEGPGFVSPDSSFDGVIWVNQTEDLALNAELTEALGPINTGYLTLGDGTITCRVAEKPARDIEIHFKAKR